MNKKIFFFLLLILTIFCLANVNAKAVEIDPLDFSKDAKSSCLIESKTNTVIFEKNKDEKLAPASMTKVMTMIIVMDNISKNKLNYNDMITTPKEAAELGGSQIYLSTGDQMSVNDLLKSMCIASANDAALTLAIHIGKTEKNFVKMMNETAKLLNLKNTHFVNAYGFDDPNHYTSSYDMAIMASYLINNYPEILKYTSTYEDYVREDTEKRFWLVNTNKLVKFVNGVDGLKTGWTEGSGYCLTATISKNNERFIAVSMGNSTPTIRNKEVTELLNYAVNNYHTALLYKKGDIIKEINDKKYHPNYISLQLEKDVVILKNKTNDLENYYYEEHIDILNDDSYIDIYYNNKFYSRVNLITINKVHKASLWELFLDVLKELFLITK